MTITPKEQLENLLRRVLQWEEQLVVDDETITVLTHDTNSFLYRLAYKVGRVSAGMVNHDFEMAVKFLAVASSFEVVDYRGKQQSTIQWTF
jgi:hypothetical protein